MKFKDTKYGDLTGQHYDGDIFVHGIDLTSLEGAPKTITGDFDCAENLLTSLEFCPERVEGNFVCYGNKLISLKFGPEYVGGYYECYLNQLTSLEGSPDVVEGFFDCSSNNLTSLKGSPNLIGSYMNCSSNQITSLDGISKDIVGGIPIDDEDEEDEHIWIQSYSNPNKFLTAEYNLRRVNPNLSDTEVMVAMYKITGVEFYLPEVVKDLFLF